MTPDREDLVKVSTAATEDKPVYRAGCSQGSDPLVTSAYSSTANNVSVGITMHLTQSPGLVSSRSRSAQ